MIKSHRFNSAWWGAPTGILRERAFFELPQAQQEEQLRAFAWVEYRQLYDQRPPVWALRNAGFAHADTQQRFKIALHRVQSSASIEDLDVRFASDLPFHVDAEQMSLFEHERFWFLPGATPARVNARYVTWANQLIKAQPQWCVQISRAGEVQGWFLSSMDPTGKRLNLTLAMLHNGATICGMHLYRKALLAYAERGARIGEASYSVTNTAVMGIYAQLKARYLAPEGYWLWTPQAD